MSPTQYAKIHDAQSQWLDSPYLVRIVPASREQQATALCHVAISKISPNLFKVMGNPKDAEGRMELARAAMMASVAFSGSLVGVVHALGHSVGSTAANLLGKARA